MTATRRAVIDIGTNSIKLLVGDVSSGLVRPVEERSEQTRLGAAFYETHELQPVPVARTASAVARFVAMARDLEARSIRVVATSAARDARNPEVLTEAVRRASGVRVEIISGEQEAEWVFLGVTSDARLRGLSLLILDVGGGSTEFILGAQGHHSFRHSFPLGTVRLLEKLRPGDPPSLHELAACRDWLEDFLRHEVDPKLAGLLGHGASPPSLVGTGGTATILARVEQQMTDYNRERIEATRLSREKVLEHLVHFWGLSLAARRRITGLPAGRADVILMGAAIYEAVMRHFGLPDLHITTRGLRFGALLDLG